MAGLTNEACEVFPARQCSIHRPLSGRSLGRSGGLNLRAAVESKHPAESAVAARITPEVFAHLVMALVFKTSGGLEESPQWVRFPYTSVFLLLHPVKFAGFWRKPAAKAVILRVGEQVEYSKLPSRALTRCSSFIGRRGSEPPRWQSPFVEGAARGRPIF